MEKEFLDLVSLLNRNKVVYKVSEHERVHTSEQAAAVRGADLRSGVKALVFDAGADRKGMVLVLVRGDHRAESEKLKSALGAKNVKLADPKEVLARTGCEVGSVHPFGNLFGLPVLMDKSIAENDAVNFSAGVHTKSITMRSADMIKIVQPSIADIAK